MVGALTNGLALGWTSLRHLSRGRVIIFDRYRLDTAVHMRFSYDEVSRFRLQSWLIRVLTPSPRRSYLLRVAPETAQTRKELQYDPRELSSLARLYDDESRRQDVAPVDGEQPRERICAKLARDVWRSLR
jgi:thymidylate kinase